MHLDTSDPTATTTPHPSYMHLTREITKRGNQIHTSMTGEIAHTSIPEIKNDHGGIESTHHTHKQPYLISHPTIRRKGRRRMQEHTDEIEKAR